MKRLLTALLAIMFFLPACGSVFASPINAASGENASVHHSGSSNHSLHKKVGSSKHSSHTAKAVKKAIGPRLEGGKVAECCEDHKDSQIGLLERGSVSKGKAIPMAVSQIVWEAVRKDGFEKLNAHPSAAPPILDRQSYAALVGIVKRLD